MKILYKIKKIINNVAKMAGLKIINISTLQILERQSTAWHEYNMLKELFDGDNGNILIQLMKKSSAQLKQDVFVLSQLNFKKNGFFVEFGAADGVILSNTLMLERDFEWTGILAEPAEFWTGKLKENRNCIIDTSCVWKESNVTLKFNQVDEKEFSTITEFSDGDSNSDARKHGKEFLVKTKSLQELLKSNNAPKIVDYLSIDTEGSEYEILSAFDFSEYSFRVITCEHNYTENRNLIHNLLKKNGYKRLFEGVSLFDDWYVNIMLADCKADLS